MAFEYVQFEGPFTLPRGDLSSRQLDTQVWSIQLELRREVRAGERHLWVAFACICGGSNPVNHIT